MSTKSKTQLVKELRLAGASAGEAISLSNLAGNLRLLSSHRASTVKTKAWPTRLIPFSLASLAGAAVGMALIVFSQTVLPGNILYPVQKASDSLAVSLDPSYRGTIMMKRAQQVKQLIADRAPSKVILGTLSDYQSEAASYKTVAANYAAFEYCKDNLRQAAVIAPASEKQAIDKALVSLDNV